MPEAVLLRGAPIAEAVRGDVATEVARLAGLGVAAKMAVVVAGDDPAVLRYAEAKGRAARALGIALEVVAVAPARGQAELDARIAALSADPAVHGVLVGLPLDLRLDAEAAIRRIDPHKDVDGLTPINLGLIALGQEAGALCPATPLACVRLAETVAPLRGRRVAVVGRGRAVGRALIPMLINRDATVTVCHTRTPDLAAALAPCEVVFVAAGRPGLVGAAQVRPGQVVIDAGISVVEGKVVGDVDAAAALPVVAALTPVPGGVGPLTSTLIFANLMRAIALQRGEGG